MSQVLCIRLGNGSCFSELIKQDLSNLAKYILLSKRQCCAERITKLPSITFSRTKLSTGSKQLLSTTTKLHIHHKCSCIKAVKAPANTSIRKNIYERIAVTFQV